VGVARGEARAVAATQHLVHRADARRIHRAAVESTLDRHVERGIHGAAHHGRSVTAQTASDHPCGEQRNPIYA
jgi:hypothetical protein